MSANLYIGLMSGTSMDSIDAALVDLSDDRCQLLHAINADIPPQLQSTLSKLCSPGNLEIDTMGSADRELGACFARAVKQLLARGGVSAEDITAIGSHGQTIRHRPNQASSSFTLQIGDPNTIAQETGITTVADFRRRDMAAGGQGAPLAPAFHQAVFSSNSCNRAIINIGGMANITLLSKQATLGFDTGPGNVLMDSWIKQQQGKDYDQDGQWAASGHSDPQLLQRLLQHPYLHKAIPKSTGREEFNLDWLTRQLDHHTLNPADVQATLLDYTAQTIADSLGALPESVDEVYICGGGAFNGQLMKTLQQRLQPRPVSQTTALGVPPEWVEAAAFAWLAQRSLAGLAGNVPSVTGASEAVILGAIYQA